MWNVASLIPNFCGWVNRIHSFQWDPMLAPAMTAKSPDTTMRTSWFRWPISSWYRSIRSSSGPVGGNAGAKRSAIIRFR